MSGVLDDGFGCGANTLMFHVERPPPLKTYVCQEKARLQEFSIVVELKVEMHSDRMS